MFLAIITCCTLVTGAIMRFTCKRAVVRHHTTRFGYSVFAVPRNRYDESEKPFALLLQSMFISIFPVFMFPPMVLLIACALVAELLTLLIFRGYKKRLGVRVCRTLYMPLTFAAVVYVLQCVLHGKRRRKSRCVDVYRRR